MAAAVTVGASGNNGGVVQEEQRPPNFNPVHAVRSSLPLPVPAVLQVLVPGLPAPSRIAGAGEGFRVPGLVVDGPALVRDTNNGRSFSVPARMGLSSSVELPGMCLDNSAPDISSIECTPFFSRTPNSLELGGTQTASAALASWTRASRRPKSQSELSYAELLGDPSGAASDSSPSTPSQRSPGSVTTKGGLSRKISADDEEAAPLPSLEKVQEMLEAQKQLFHNQLQDLEKVLAVQCSLTGVNPLSHEMAIAVLGSKAVKKSEEPLTPEAVRSLREVYAVRDTITRKEVRELSNATGATFKQVRDFFARQQSRVKKLMQAAQEEAGKVSPVAVVTHSHEPAVSGGGDSLDKLLNMMRAENSFAGQSRLVQIILQAEHLQMLRMFLEKGGMRILGKWILQAAAEEQTGLIRQILKALAHLPVMHAVPAQLTQMAAVVTRLRTYFVADIATRARSLLGKWTKMLSSGKVLPPPQEPGKPSSSLMMNAPEKKKLKTEPAVAVKPAIPKPPPAISNMPNLKGLDNSEKPPTSNLTVRRPVEDQANRKRLADLGKEKRKVLLVEELGGATSRRVRDRDGEGRKSSSAMDKASRPLSADDIQKAKMRARFLQGNAKPRPTQDNSSTSTATALRPENDVRDTLKPSQSLQLKLPPPPTLSSVQASPPLPPPSAVISTSVTEPRAEDLEGKEYASEAAAPKVVERVIPWIVPPVALLDPDWNVAAGEESKEKGIQSARVCRELEEFYCNPDSIPKDPKEPWDDEVDYDDSLTPQVPMESDEQAKESSPTRQQQASSSAPQVPSHDPELLALLLSNPALMSQLSAGSQSAALDHHSKQQVAAAGFGLLMQQQQQQQFGGVPPFRDGYHHPQKQQQGGSGGAQYYSREGYNNVYGGGYSETGGYGGEQLNSGSGGGGVGNWNVGNNHRVSNNNHLPFLPPPPPTTIDASSRFPHQPHSRPQNWFGNNKGW